MTYKVNLEIFEGPLDLLLYLIKKGEFNIQDIPIAVITEQYLGYMELMRMLDLDIAGEFLVMAATLMHIKSKMLLPPEEMEEEQEEEDPREELVKKLLEYRKFKEAAERLKAKEEQQKEVFSRPGSKPAAEPGDEDDELYFEANIFDLLSAFSKVLKEVPKNEFYEVIKDEVTVSEKIHEIFHILVKKPVIYFLDLFGRVKDKIDIIATFLALLELIRMKEILVRQDRIFGDIKIIRNSKRITPPKVEEVDDDTTGADGRPEPDKGPAGNPGDSAGSGPAPKAEPGPGQEPDTGAETAR